MASASSVAATLVARLLKGERAEAQPAGPTGPKAARADATITLKINGENRSVAIDNRTTLLDALRERLALTGSKKGCDHGQCGACTVLVNGRRINSCMTLALMHEGGFPPTDTLVAAQTVVIFSPNLPHAPLALTLKPGGTFTGTVHDSATGAPAGSLPPRTR